MVKRKRRPCWKFRKCELELKIYKKNGDEKKKKTLALKEANLFNDEDVELDKFNPKDKEDEMALLSKKLHIILKDKRNKEKRKKNYWKPRHLDTQPTCFESKKPRHFKPNCLVYLKNYWKMKKER